MVFCCIPAFYEAGCRADDPFETILSRLIHFNLKVSVWITRFCRFSLTDGHKPVQCRSDAKKRSGSLPQNRRIETGGGENRWQSMSDAFNLWGYIADVFFRANLPSRAIECTIYFRILYHVPFVIYYHRINCFLRLMVIRWGLAVTEIMVSGSPSASFMIKLQILPFPVYFLQPK